MSERIRVASASEVPPGSFKQVEAGDRKLLVYNVDGAFYATTSVCVHQGGPLEDGLFEGNAVTCPWHAWQFDVCTGTAVFDPQFQLETFSVHLDGDELLVDV